MPAKTLSVVEFGKRLLDTNDLDPVYVLLWEARLDEDLLKRWLLAYWCFYHMGTASWIASRNGGAYWGRMEMAAGSKDYPRCPERRHFRGANAAKSVAYLKSIGLEDLFYRLLDFANRGPLAVHVVMNRVKKWVGFGPWIAFKVADMIDRLALAEVTYDYESVFLFDSPYEGARRALLAASNPVDDLTPTEIGRRAVEHVLDGVGVRKSPPRYDRSVGIPEAETILCKWKSYLNGHYTVGEDIEGCRNGLSRFESVPLCGRLLAAGKSGGLW